MNLSGTIELNRLGVFKIAWLQGRCFWETWQASKSNNGLHVGCGPTSRLSTRVVAYEVGRVVATLSPATLTCNLTSIHIYQTQLNLFVCIYEDLVWYKGLHTKIQGCLRSISLWYQTQVHNTRPLNTPNQSFQPWLPHQPETSKPLSNATAS